jgi:hypothetical protein
LHDRRIKPQEENPFTRQIFCSELRQRLHFNSRAPTREKNDCRFKWPAYAHTHTHIDTYNACIEATRTHALAGGEGKWKIDAKGSPRQPTGNRCCQQPRCRSMGEHAAQGWKAARTRTAPPPLLGRRTPPRRRHSATPAWCGTQTGELSCLL